MLSRSRCKFEAFVELPAIIIIMLSKLHPPAAVRGRFGARVRLAVAALAASFALGACGGGSGSDETFELTLLHINDHHSRLDSETTTLQLRNAAGTKEAITVDWGGFARVAGAIEALATGKPHVLKLHAGDAVTGDLYYTLDEGKSDAAMMNAVCFDAFALGNHEFDNGDAGLRKFLDFLAASSSCKTAVLSANLKPRPGSPIGAIGERVKRSTIVQRGKEYIGIVGITIGGKTSASSRPDAGTTFEDEVTAAQREIDELRRDGINKIVLLTHYTYDGDKQLAARLSGVDVIVGGDSHTLLGGDGLRSFGLTPEGPYPTLATNRDGKRVCIVQAWQYSFVVGELRVKFDRFGDVLECPGQPHVLIGDTLRRGNTVVTGADQTAMLADIASEKQLRITAPQPAAAAVLAPFRAAKDAFGATVVGRTNDNLCLRRVPGSKRDITRSTLGDVCNRDARVIAHGGDAQQMVAAAFLEQAKRFGGADIALQNGGGVRVDLAAGELTVGRIYTLLPFKNLLVRFTMTGAEIKATLEDAVAFVLAGSGNTGAYPYTANLRWSVDLNQPRGARISAMQFKNAQGQWMPFDLNASYKLVTNDFLAAGGDGYATLATIPAARRENTFLDYADPFLQYVKANTPLARLPVAEYSTQSFTDTP